MKLYNLNSDSLFCDFFESYNAASKANETTIQCRRHRLETFASSIYYEPWRVLTKADMLNWRTNLEEITEISTRTKNAIIGTIKQVSKHAYAVYDQYDVGSVLSTFPLTLKDHHEIKIITVEDFYKMMSFENDDELEAFFIFLYRTGCRKGEARALKVEDYDPVKHCIYIYKSMRRYEDSLKTTKTSNSRYVILDQETDNLVRYQVNKNRKYLFGDTKPLPLSRITDHYKKDLELAGLPDNTIHSLRHSNVSLLWSMGVPVPEISKRIGHSSQKTTMDTYSHIFDIDQEKSVNALNSKNSKKKVKQ